MIDPLVITSYYGKRKFFKKPHFGVDLRSVFDGVKADIRLPEAARLIRKTFQDDWGTTLVFNTLETDNEIKFTHVCPVDMAEGIIYKKGTLIGYTTTTKHMRENKFYEHLHFEVWPYNEKGKRAPIDPLIYFEYLGLEWHDKEEYDKENNN